MCNVDGVRAPRRHREGPSRDAGRGPDRGNPTRRRRRSRPRRPGTPDPKHAPSPFFLARAPSKLLRATSSAFAAADIRPLPRAPAVEAAQIPWGSRPDATHPPATPRAGSARARGPRIRPSRETKAMATHVLRRPTAVYRVADLQELPILASGHANADLAQLRSDARLRATADEIHRALDVRREDDVRRGSPTSVGDSLDSDSSGSGRRKRATDSPLRKKSRRRTASFARSLLPTERASFDACLRDVLTHRGLNEDHLPLLNRTAKCAVARNASSAGARRELHALVCNGEKLSVVRSLSACAAAGLAPRFWNCDTEPEGLVEAVQTHAPFVMRGRARRDDAFGSAMRALGDEATLRKVAPSSIVDVREHSVELRDGGRLYAPSSRSMRCEEALAQRDRHAAGAARSQPGAARADVTARRPSPISMLPPPARGGGPPTCLVFAPSGRWPGAVCACRVFLGPAARSLVAGCAQRGAQCGEVIGQCSQFYTTKIAWTQNR